ncbi:pentapeptide repeat-containing protein [Spirillospora sp. NPDC049024]
MEQPPEYRPVKNAHRALGMWSMRQALTVAFSGASVMLVAAWFFVTWLLGSPPPAQPKPLDTAAQLDLLKLVFALVAGAGALVALVTAYRRQRVDEVAAERAERAQEHAERVAREAAYDATERRVTELYGQAVEQLGHDKAAVRLGGLYSLERLAQDHAQHRQTVVDVVCAYLRMPFQPSPPDQGTEATAPDPAGDAARQELQVRLAAQRLLHRHLTVVPGTEFPGTYWDDMVIDLTEAHLIDFEFSRCRPGQATFARARFSGDAWFKETHFTRDASFNEAQFTSNCWFSEAQFSAHTWFQAAQFADDTYFDRVQFNGATFFDDAQFYGVTMFGETRFGGDVRFTDAQFSAIAFFEKVQFSGSAWFTRVQFSRGASFDEVQSSRRAWFTKVQFSGRASFDGARFSGDTTFDDAQFSDEARFDRAQFSGDASFNKARFRLSFPRFHGHLI